MMTAHDPTLLSTDMCNKASPWPTSTARERPRPFRRGVLGRGDAGVEREGTRLRDPAAVPFTSGGADLRIQPDPGEGGSARLRTVVKVISLRRCLAGAPPRDPHERHRLALPTLTEESW